MTDPRQLSTHEAARWHARLGNRSVTQKTLRDFEAWREHPANDAAYQDVDAFWEASGRQANDPEIVRLYDSALARRARGRQPRPKRATFWGVMAACAGVAAAVLVGFNLAYPAYVTGPTEQRVVLLKDGSRVHLNVGSKVRVMASGETRRLILSRGEAFFEVAHDARRPFIVDAGNAGVRAIGTKFDVRRDQDNVSVTLLEGVVRVDRNHGAGGWTLKPNQQLNLRNDRAARATDTDAARATSWTTGRLIFRQTPLAEAVTEINRYGPHKIELEGADLPGRQINGVFNIGDTGDFVKGIIVLFDLQSTTDADGTVRLRAKLPAVRG